jgi:hypothetical protein
MMSLLVQLFSNEDPPTHFKFHRSRSHRRRFHGIGRLVTAAVTAGIATAITAITGAVTRAIVAAITSAVSRAITAAVTATVATTITAAIDTARRWRRRSIHLAALRRSIDLAARRRRRRSIDLAAAAAPIRDGTTRNSEVGCIGLGRNGGGGEREGCREHGGYPA